ncbi:EthD family reductase [Nocardioides psychrotolerans]|uniref:EthD family reductase n=1 Tax=Nocardioides psychrotolerans TaxID=1005945 RepID=UPI0031381D57
MHRLTIEYTAPADVEAFEAHYRDVHVPLVNGLPGLRRFVTSHPRGLGGDAPYLVAELWFDDAESMASALKTPEMGATATDADALCAATGVASRLMFTGDLVDHL